MTSSASAPERIEIGPGAGRLSSVRLRALESDVEIERASVVYVDGATEPLALAGPLRTGATTPWLTVRSDRFVAAVEVVRAQRAGARGTPTLEAYGLYADDWLLPGGEGSRTSGGWVRLGAQTAVARIGYDTLGFEIGANKGGFKKVRIEARDRAISVSELKVLYASGEVEIVRFGQKVSAGASSTAVDLRGASRVIKEIQVKTRARFIDRDARARDAAIIEVWGLL